MKLTYVSIAGRGVVVFPGSLQAPDAVNALYEMGIKPGDDEMLDLLAFLIDTDDIPKEFTHAFEDPANHKRLVTAKEAPKLFGSSYDPSKEPN